MLAVEAANAEYDKRDFELDEIRIECQLNSQDEVKQALRFADNKEIIETSR